MKMYICKLCTTKIDVVLVQIQRYNCSETDYSLCEDSLPNRTPPSTRMRVSPSDPFSPPLFFSLHRPGTEVKPGTHYPYIRPVSTGVIFGFRWSSNPFKEIESSTEAYNINCCLFTVM